MPLYLFPLSGMLFSLLSFPWGTPLHPSKPQLTFHDSRVPLLWLRVPCFVVIILFAILTVMVLESGDLALLGPYA